MVGSFIERQMQNALQNILHDKAASIMKGISKLAAQQGGDSIIENYQLLGKRTLIVVGVTVVTVQVVSSVVGYVVARRNEEQRIERVVRRVLDEERDEAK